MHATNNAKADQARKWLAALRSRVLETHINAEPDSLQVWDKRDLWNECPQFARGEFADIRNEAIEHLTTLHEQ